MSNRTLLFEIGMEECPARFVAPARADLARLTAEALREARLVHGEVRAYATPRRLAVVVEGVADRQADLEAEVKGPPARIAFDATGQPTKAAVGFAANQGVAVDELVVKETEGGSYVFALKREAGLSAEEVLPGVLSGVAAGLKFPKSMRWNESGVRFARPIRWIVALLGERVLDLQFAGVRAGNVTQGHRFLGERFIALSHAGEYVEALARRGAVVVDMEARIEAIRRQVEEIARSIGGRAGIDEGLLEEVANLVEHPTALAGSFDERYLAVPGEILVTSMKEHQRYFPVYAESGALLPRFIAVRNGSAEHIDVVRAGNERVLSARLSDARFFYEEDLKRPLASRVDELKGIVFQEKLGTVWEKQERARSVAREAGAAYPESVRSAADRALALAKADLVTHVVYEFPELQGVMGREYALKSGEDPDVAEAIFEHYLPRFADDELPKTQAGILAAVSDKIDTITGCFGIGLAPTGSADPYGLRRQALGIIKISLAHRVPFTLGELVDASLRAYGDRIPEHERIRREVLEFFRGRLHTLLIEEGIRHDLVEAALAAGVHDLRAAYGRAKALAKAAGSEGFAALLTAFQRAANLASKATGAPVDDALFEHGAERALWEAVQRISSVVRECTAGGRFDDAIAALAGLKAPVDAFFDAVLVMAPDEKVRNNRLSVLAGVVEASRPVGDLRKVTNA